MINCKQYKLTRLSIAVLLIMGMLVPADAITWDAKLRGKLSLAALLGAIAVWTEWRIHRDQQQLDGLRESMGLPLSFYGWREGFDTLRLECYTRGHLLLRDGVLFEFCVFPAPTPEACSGNPR